jgi:hypothetical protein
LNSSIKVLITSKRKSLTIISITESKTNSLKYRIHGSVDFNKFLPRKDTTNADIRMKDYNPKYDLIFPKTPSVVPFQKQLGSNRETSLPKEKESFDDLNKFNWSIRSKYI